MTNAETSTFVFKDQAEAVPSCHGRRWSGAGCWWNTRRKSSG